MFWPWFTNRIESILWWPLEVMNRFSWLFSIQYAKFYHVEALKQKNIAFSGFSRTDGHTTILTCSPKNSILLILNEIFISFGWGFYQLDMKEDCDNRICECNHYNHRYSWKKWPANTTVVHCTLTFMYFWSKQASR